MPFACSEPLPAPTTPVSAVRKRNSLRKWTATLAQKAIGYSEGIGRRTHKGLLKKFEGQRRLIDSVQSGSYIHSR